MQSSKVVMGFRINRDRTRALPRIQRATTSRRGPIPLCKHGGDSGASGFYPPDPSMPGWETGTRGEKREPVNASPGNKGDVRIGAGVALSLAA
jgi:hypothetical protein